MLMPNGGLEVVMTERFLRLPEVMETVGSRRTVIYDKITRGEFPAPVKIGSVSFWLASEISAYIGETEGDGSAGGFF